MTLLEVVLLERIHIVARRFLLLFFGGLVVGGDEVDRLAVGRPGEIAGRGWMRGQPPRFTAVDAEQIDLVDGVRIAAGREGDQLAVRRPARAVLTALAERELDL